MEQKRKLIRRIAVFLVVAIIFGSVGRYNCGKAEIVNGDAFPPNIVEKEEASMWVSTDKLNGKKDDIITLTFTYTGTESINSIEFDVSFDNSLLELCNYEPIDRLCSSLNYYSDAGYFAMYTLDVDKYYIDKGEQFLSMQFKCMENIGKESIIKFTDIDYFFANKTGEHNFKEGYSVKLTPEFGMEVIADKVNNIKKGDIITFMFTYTGTIPSTYLDYNIYYDKDILEIYNYELINKLYERLTFNQNTLTMFVELTDYVTGTYTDENSINKGEQFFKIQFKCLKDTIQESTIKFLNSYFFTKSWGNSKDYIEYDAENYCSSFKLFFSSLSAPIVPTGGAIAPDCKHLFNDYDYTSSVKGSPVIIYGNGINKKIDGNVVNNKQFTAYTDILPSYNYTLNSKGIVKPSSGKVIAGITTSSIKPVVSKNKIVDRDAAKIAKASIKNGQVTVTAAGKEKGLVYLWIIDTGKNGAYECCPVNVLIAPIKLEARDISGNRLKKPFISQGDSLDVCVAGIVPGGSKTDDCTYTAMVEDASQDYVKVTPVQDKNGQFKITATGLKNNKNTKVSIIFTCNENKKKVKLAVTIKK